MLTSIRRYPALVATGIVLSGLLSPASAIAGNHNGNGRAVAVADRNEPTVLTSHLPWLAPVGHRQPRQIDVLRNETASAWQRQRDRDEELDRKLSICRDC